MGEPLFYVYEHWRPDRDECFYVGKGKGKRANVLSKRNGHHTAIQHKLSRLGLCVEVRLVATGLTEAEAFALEVERIAFWRADGADLANYTAGGDGRAGYTLSADARARISAKITGCKRTPEQIEAMRRTKLGRKQNPETVAKRAAANTGKRRSAEFCARMKEFSNRPEVRAAKIAAHTKPVLCRTNGKIYASAREASEELGVDSSMVSKVCRGEFKAVKGYSFSFATNSEVDTK